MVDRAFIAPPASRLAPLTPEERSQVVQASVLCGHYERPVDRESAYEKLKERAQVPDASAQPGAQRAERGGAERSQTADLLGALAKSAAHAIGSQIGRQIIRGVLGSLLGGSRRR
jgi:hypothetical protein